MVRPLRLEYEGAVYHVTSRGNERAAIFRDDRDRARFLEILGSVVSSARWAFHAYCLMGQPLPSARGDAAEKPLPRDATPQRGQAGDGLEVMYCFSSPTTAQSYEESNVQDGRTIRLK